MIIDLNWIDIKLKHSQLQQLITVLEAVSLYTKLQWVKYNIITINLDVKKEYQLININGSTIIAIRVYNIFQQNLSNRIKINK